MIINFQMMSMILITILAPIFQDHDKAIFYMVQICPIEMVVAYMHTVLKTLKKKEKRKIKRNKIVIQY